MAFSQQGAVQRMRRLEKRGRSYMHLRKVRSFEDEFDLVEFAEHAQELYVEAHKALAE